MNRILRGHCRYAYAFDVIEDSGTRFAFYCGNQNSGVIRDSILFRTAKLNSSGHWAYSDDERVIDSLALISRCLVLIVAVGSVALNLAVVAFRAF